MKTSLAWLIAAVTLVGCANQAESPANANNAPAPEPANNAPVPEPVNSTETGSNAEVAPTPDAETVTNLPSELNHDGLRYSGLNANKVLSYKVSQKGMPDNFGELKVTRTEVKDGKLKIERQRTGLAQLGNDSVEVRKDGVYVVKMANVDLSTATLELPADLSVGTTWSDTSEIEVNGVQMKNKATYKVVGDKSVKVPGGTFTCREITASGTISINGAVNPLKVNAFYAKDVGLIRMQLDTKSNGQDVSFDMVLNKAP